MARGSPITADVKLRRLKIFCEHNKTTAKQLAMLGRRDRKTVEDMLQDHVTRMEMNGNAPSYISGIIKAVKSWLDHNEVDFKRKIKISNADATPTLENERVPEKHELIDYQVSQVISPYKEVTNRLISLFNEEA